MSPLVRNKMKFTYNGISLCSPPHPRVPQSPEPSTNRDAHTLDRQAKCHTESKIVKFQFSRFIRNVMKNTFFAYLIVLLYVGIIQLWD